ncbi:hypothetical protein ACQ5SK_17265 [Bradyrhizobium japonicum]
MLEVRSREVPFILEHGQIVGRLVYEKMLARPTRCTASASARTTRRRGSNYRSIFGCSAGLTLRRDARLDRGIQYAATYRLYNRCLWNTGSPDPSPPRASPGQQLTRPPKP